MKIKMEWNSEKTFGEGCEEYLLDCKARNLREGTIKHYRDTIRQLVKYIDEDTPIQSMSKAMIDTFVIELRDNPALNDQSLYTYARDLKTLMYFFMKKEYVNKFKIVIPKADKQPIETYTDSELTVLLKKPNLKKCDFTEYKSWVMTNFLLSTG